MLSLLDSYVARLPRAKSAPTSNSSTKPRDSDNSKSRSPFAPSRASWLDDTWSTTTSIFPNFSQLPTEIRLQIWRSALEFEKRYVQITHNRSLDGFVSDSRAPVLLSVNREARAEAQKHLYSVPGAARRRGSAIGSVFVQGPPIYFYPSRDIVVVFAYNERALGDTISHFSDSTRQGIQRLIVVYNVRRQTIWRCLKNESYSLLDLPNLVDLYVVQRVKQESAAVPLGPAIDPENWTWIGKSVLDLIVDEGRHSFVEMSGWDQDQDARINETKYRIDGSWIWHQTLGKVVCWHGIRRDPRQEDQEGACRI